MNRIDINRHMQKLTFTFMTEWLTGRNTVARLGGKNYDLLFLSGGFYNQKRPVIFCAIN